MIRGIQGRYQQSTLAHREFSCFIPYPLPPEPDIEWSHTLRELFDRAVLALGRLDGISDILPNTSFFLYMYVRKEAVVSSMIEGTQSSLSDLLSFEITSNIADSILIDDVQEVSNYVRALNYGIEKLNANFPLSLRLLREIHAILLSSGRGKGQDPGNFRRSQNWIGGASPKSASFVPPPPESLSTCMGELELFLHNKPLKTSTLIKAALTHVQFETIHPFLDGNGRLGRLLIMLLLYKESVLKEPLLYLSLYFKTHRAKYYKLLNAVRTRGNWEAWLEFFAEAVLSTAEEAVETARRILSIAEEDKKRIFTLKHISGSLALVHQVMLSRTIASPRYIESETGLAAATVNSCLQELEKLGIVTEITGRSRNRMYSYHRILSIVNEGIGEPFSE